VTFKVADVEFELPKSPVGILCSGGADSTLLLYLLMKHSNFTIHVLTLTNQAKNFANLAVINSVLKWCINHTQNTNIIHHTWYAKEQTNKELEKLPLELLQSKMFSTLYIGDTCYPPDDINQRFADETNDIFQNIKARTPNETRPTKIGPIYVPYTNYNKKKIVETYKSENIMELFHLTRSCETTSDIGTEHCGNCWWCKEREWAVDCNNR
jgi:7-cyano-7-deazaguanine synthase in queuosine biosynthesis